MLLTRAPLYWPPCGGFRARLACVRHAASVDSEPGSNSQKEPPDRRSNCPPSLAFEWPPRLITRNDFTSGVFHPVVKQRSPRPEAKGAPWGANRFTRRQNRPRTFAATAPRSHTADPRSRFLRGLQQALRLREAGRFHRPGTTTAPSSANRASCYLSAPWPACQPIFRPTPPRRLPIAGNRSVRAKTLMIITGQACGVKKKVRQDRSGGLVSRPAAVRGDEADP